MLFFSHKVKTLNEYFVNQIVCVSWTPPNLVAGLTHIN